MSGSEIYDLVNNAIKLIEKERGIEYVVRYIEDTCAMKNTNSVKVLFPLYDVAMTGKVLNFTIKDSIILQEHINRRLLCRDVNSNLK